MIAKRMVLGTTAVIVAGLLGLVVGASVGQEKKPDLKVYERLARTTR